MTSIVLPAATLLSRPCPLWFAFVAMAVSYAAGSALWILQAVS